MENIILSIGVFAFFVTSFFVLANLFYAAHEAFILFMLKRTSRKLDEEYMKRNS